MALLTGNPGVPRGPGRPGKPLSPCQRRRWRREGKQGGRCCCAELHPHGPPAPPWGGKEGRDPMAGLIPLQLLPTAYFGSRRALEGKDQTRVRGRQVGSKLLPCGVRSEPQTCGRGKDSPVSREFQGVPVGQGGQCHPARTTEELRTIPQSCIFYNPAPSPGGFYIEKQEIHPKYSFQSLTSLPTLPLPAFLWVLASQGHRGVLACPGNVGGCDTG